MLAKVSSVNPLSTKPKPSVRSGSSSPSIASAVGGRGGGMQAGKGSSNGGLSSSSSGSTAAAQNKEVLESDPATEAVKAFHSLLGLSVTEARDLYRQGEAGGGGAEGGAAALKKELDRRKAAYIRVVLTVAPSLGMSHGNPALQGEVRRSRFIKGFSVLLGGRGGEGGREGDGGIKEARIFKVAVAVFVVVKIGGVDWLYAAPLPPAPETAALLG